MRFSLVDCLFSEDKPFIILDDSFVDFDEANLSIIKEVLNKLKEEYQIIYFTCHESRVMDQEVRIISILVLKIYEKLTIEEMKIRFCKIKLTH